MSKYTKFILVKGDVSGIQEFIFNVKSDGAARELKGRSFFIKLLIEVAMQYLFDHFGIKDVAKVKVSKISTSGGNFILKLPALDNFESKILTTQQLFTKSLEFTGLNLSLACVEQSEDFRKDIHKLNSRCREAKYRFYKEDINYFNCFNKKQVADLSLKWNIFTTLIQTNKTYEICKSTTQSVHLNIQQSLIEFAGYIIAFGANQGHILDAHIESLFPFNSRNGIKEFKDLCKNDIVDIRLHQIKELNGGERGLEKLGILAMDVDGLGERMEHLHSENENADFDKSLRLFFNDQLRQIINDTAISYLFKFKDRSSINIPKFQNKIYSVTAGGDDSFFVGKWNTILDFAIKIKTEFNAKFPDLTISAGIVIVDAKFPVVRFADLVESALKKAKYHYDSKGNICLFDEVIKWDMLHAILDMRKLLARKEITGGMLAKARLSANKITDDTAFRLKDFWKMGYYLRDLDEGSKTLILDKIEQHISKSITEKDIIRKRNYRKILPIAARLAELDKR